MGQKRKRQRNAPDFRRKQPKSGAFQVLEGMRAGAGRCKRMQTDAKTRCLNQREHINHTTHGKRKPAETQCFRRFCGRGRRTRSALPLRSARSVRATGTHSPLGTRFWSGCGETHQRAGKGQCCPVLLVEPPKWGASSVLRNSLGWFLTFV